MCGFIILQNVLLNSVFKMLSRALLNCHQAAAEAGYKFALEEFTSGRNRLENEGAKAMADVFEVGGCYFYLDVFNEEWGLGIGNINTCLDDAKWYQPPWNCCLGKGIGKKHKFTSAGSQR